MSRGPGVRRLGVMARLTRLDIPGEYRETEKSAAEEQSDDEIEGEEGRDRERKDTAESERMQEERTSAKARGEKNRERYKEHDTKRR